MTVARPLNAVCLAASIVVSSAALPAFAVTSWSVPAGSSSTVTYSGGQTQNGLFTASSPSVAGDNFVFTPQHFSASSDKGSSANDVASTLITAKNGFNLGTFTAHLGGDYSILDGGPVTSFSSVRPLVVLGNSVNATGLLTLTNPTTHAVLSKAFDFGGDFNSPTGDGEFGDDVSIKLPAGWKSATVALSAGVTATATPGSTSFVQLKTASFGVETTQVAAVPLPPAMLAAIPTVALAYVARRRMARA